MHHSCKVSAALLRLLTLPLLLLFSVATPSRL